MKHIPRNRLEAFSDGVLAILITIMVLELKPPEGANLAALKPLWPTFLSYVLSFVYLGIYWNNHHHMLQATRQIDGRVMWANLHLLFWLSLFPFVTAWVGQSHGAAWPTALYGSVFWMAAVAYYILQRAIVRLDGAESALARAVGRAGKEKISLICYAVAVGFAFVSVWISNALYVLVAVLWLVPDQRIERGAE